MKFRNLTLVLKGNNPRFPWASFRTTLNLRLIGTIGGPASPRPTTPASTPTT